MTLATPRLLLRRWRQEDRLPFARLNADPAVMAFFPARLSPEESDRFIERIEEHFERHGFGLWAAQLRESPGCIGYIGLWTLSFEAHFTPAVEIGWRLAAEHWGRGLATEGAREVLRWGFEEAGLDEIVSCTAVANSRSRRVMEKIGLTHDPRDDFDHPGLPEGHPLRRHVLYRLRREAWAPERETDSARESGDPPIPRPLSTAGPRVRSSPDLCRERYPDRSAPEDSTRNREYCRKNARA